MKKLNNQNKVLVTSGIVIAALAVGVFSFYNRSVKINQIEDSTEADTQIELVEESTEKMFSTEELAWMESEADRILAKESSLSEEATKKESIAALIAQTEAATQDEAEVKTQSFDTETAGDTVIETTTYTEKVIPEEDPTVQTNGDYSGIIQNPSQATSGNTYSEPITTKEPEVTTSTEESNKVEDSEKESQETTTTEQSTPETTINSDGGEPETTTIFVEQETTQGNVSWDAFWANAEEYDVNTNKSIPAHFDLTGEHTGY